MSSPSRPRDEGRALQLVYYAYVAGSAVARWLPERVAYGAARIFGRFAARLLKSKRAVVERNLARITGAPAGSPEVQELVVKAFQSYARYWLETFRLVREDSEFFRDRFRCETEHRLWASVGDGRGAIAAVGHLGNWDAAGAWVGATGFNLVTVAEVLRPRRMFDFFVDHRSRLGMTIFPAEKGVTTRLRDAAEDGAVVAILADRDLKGTGPMVTFFGEEVSFPAGAASIALAADLPLHVAGVWGVTLPDGRRGWEAEISELIPRPQAAGEEGLREMMQSVANKLEEYVARRPEEWHACFQRFWPSDRAST
ncbi:MAG: phosphatidylinositol dimannoside acyltransferase [Actinomycetota bacterium]|jgi:KDO2-lipid IV(A) lauroyltransferase|nr:phosphatidylinositol dimannoside acyltransferase [Actinomycetota bacterium]